MGSTTGNQAYYSSAPPPPAMTTFVPPQKSPPLPQSQGMPNNQMPQQSAMGAPMQPQGQSPFASLWTGAMLGSLLSQALAPGLSGMANGMPGMGGQMPQGAPNALGPSGFSTGSTAARGGGVGTGGR